MDHRWIVDGDDAYTCDNDCGASYDPHAGETRLARAPGPLSERSRENP